MNDKTKLLLFWVLALSSLAADQASKFTVFHWLANPETRHVHTLFQKGEQGGFHLVAQFQYDVETGQLKKDASGNPIPYVNQGALFGMGGKHQGLANGIFAVVSCGAAMGIIYWSMQKGSLAHTPLMVALAFILGGTTGNFFDRIAFSGVRDFLHWNLWFDWPVFNLADCWLVGGAILLMTLMFFAPKEEKPQAV